MAQYWKQIDQYIWRHKRTDNVYDYIYGKITAGNQRKGPFFLSFKHVIVNTDRLTPTKKTQLMKTYFGSPRYCTDQDQESFALMLADQNYDMIKNAYQMKYNSVADYNDDLHNQLLSHLKHHLIEERKVTE